MCPLDSLKTFNKKFLYCFFKQILIALFLKKAPLKTAKTLQIKTKNNKRMNNLHPFIIILFRL